MDGRIEAMKGIWDFVESDNMDEYLKEIGVGMMGRMAAKAIKPRLIISETDGKWTIRTETNVRRMSIEFIPNVEYEEITADGRELKGIVRFEDGKWIQTMRDKNGKVSMITRWIDDQDQQQIILECGKAKAHRVHKRVREE
ncbi:unnamed protein product [Adineta ricciae]|uniref:Uncharacterized protein n=1 Tax=Adineta ricciae TaxID=249248 RepID=A0A814C8C8_ADIRI|nr:unnamed protein product [Adineta ricciae]